MRRHQRQRQLQLQQVSKSDLSSIERDKSCIPGQMTTFKTNPALCLPKHSTFPSNGPLPLQNSSEQQICYRSTNSDTQPQTQERERRLRIAEGKARRIKEDRTINRTDRTKARKRRGKPEKLPFVICCGKGPGNRLADLVAYAGLGGNLVRRCWTVGLLQVIGPRGLFLLSAEEGTVVDQIRVTTYKLTSEYCFKSH